MMLRSILSVRIGNWAYSPVEYELLYEPLRVVKGQVVADFIVDHGVESDDTSLVLIHLWKVFFDGSICTKGYENDCVIVSPEGIV
jgi:hypothetical protein